MSTDLCSQHAPAWDRREPIVNLGVSSEMSNDYAAWADPSYTTPGYQRFPMLGTNTSLMFNTYESCISPSKCTTSEPMTRSHETTTVSPQQTYLLPEQSSPTCYTLSTFDPHHVPIPANSTHGPGNSQYPAMTRGSSSSPTSDDLPSPSSTLQRSTVVGRKRKVQDMEADSAARYTYLEKNRKAASKCRSKQRRQQEELVEQARDYERKNKCLKAEVALLQEGMRELMQVVGQHCDCPDSRLRRYVQLEADRLANVGSRISS
ncbi:hypothetical protein ACEQ8H_007256 [Pleosporales sp. CAS-2024a]